MPATDARPAERPDVCPTGVSHSMCAEDGCVVERSHKYDDVGMEFDTCFRCRNDTEHPVHRDVGTPSPSGRGEDAPAPSTVTGTLDRLEKADAETPIRRIGPLDDRPMHQCAICRGASGIGDEVTARDVNHRQVQSFDGTPTAVECPATKIAAALTALPALLAVARAADLANRRLDMYLPDAEAGLVGEAHDDVWTAQRYLSESLALLACYDK